jgi:isocitrate dehydrogenase kinase/phosphatase
MKDDIKDIFPTNNFKYITLLDRIKLIFTKMQHTFDYDNHGYYTCVDYKIKNGHIYIFKTYQVKGDSFVINDGIMSD